MTLTTIHHHIAKFQLSLRHVNILKLGLREDTLGFRILNWYEMWGRDAVLGWKGVQVSILKWLMCCYRLLTVIFGCCLCIVKSIYLLGHTCCLSMLTCSTYIMMLTFLQMIFVHHLSLLLHKISHWMMWVGLLLLMGIFVAGHSTVLASIYRLMIHVLNTYPFGRWELFTLSLASIQGMLLGKPLIPSILLLFQIIVLDDYFRWVDFSLLWLGIILPIW